MDISLDLFTPKVSIERQHMIFRRLMQADHPPERETLKKWAEGFSDRDGKFIQEFQLTFESSFWELYLNAILRKLGHHAKPRASQLVLLRTVRTLGKREVADKLAELSGT